MTGYSRFRTFAFTVGELVILVLLMEILARWAPFRQVLPTPSIGLDNRAPEIEVKLNRLEIARQGGTVNCLIIGSSMVESGLDPAVIASRTPSGRSRPVCFNFGLSGSTMETSAQMAEVLDGLFHPDLFLLGTSAVEYDGNTQDYRWFSSLNWINYRLGVFSWQGWLVDHSMIYRQLLAVARDRDQAMREAIRIPLEEMDGSGFHVRRRVFDSASIARIELRLPNFQINPVDLAGLDGMARLRPSGTRLIVIEMPIQPAAFPRYLEGGREAYETRFILPLSAYLQERNIPFLRVQDAVPALLSPEDWVDGWHLNQSGSRKFSSWVAGHLPPDGKAAQP